MQKVVSLLLVLLLFGSCYQQESLTPDAWDLTDRQLDSISFSDYYLGRFGMEPKVQAVASVSKTDGLIGPIKGARGVYFVQVSNRFDMQQIDPEQLRLGQEFNSRRSIGMVQRGRYLSMDRRIFWWLRSNANVNDHRDLMY